MHNLLLGAFPGIMGVQVNIVSSVGILSADGRRSLSAATCSGRYTAPNISVDKGIRNLSFAARGGSEEPVPTPGFATFPPPECNDGVVCQSLDLVGLWFQIHANLCTRQHRDGQSQMLAPRQKSSAHCVTQIVSVVIAILRWMKKELPVKRTRGILWNVIPSSLILRVAGMAAHA